MPCAPTLKRSPALPLLPNKHTLIHVSFSELMQLLLNYGVFIELHKKENFPHYSLHEIYHSELGHGRHPFSKQHLLQSFTIRICSPSLKYSRLRKHLNLNQSVYIILIKALKPLIIHSKYFPDSDWLKAHA